MRASKILTSLLALFLACGTLVYVSSCKKDKCKDVDCLNGGVCDDGDCDCVNGFTGSECQIAPDPCLNIDCENNGVCVSGACDCATGYEGDNCHIVTRTKFLTTNATVTEVCSGVGTSPYFVDIIPTTAINQVMIRNLGNYACWSGDYYVVATVTPAGLSITNDSVCSNAFLFNATGTLNGNQLTINYTASYDPGTGTVTDNCTAIIQL